MYLDYYSLKLKPFELSPDPKFLWLGENHKEALAGLEYGILENKGFMSLTGNVGTGKTTIVNALANKLRDNIIFVQIVDPSLEELDFFNMTADVLEMNKKFSAKGQFLIELKHFLINAYTNNKKVVLVIEEAQGLDQELLEQIRLLSNIERSDKKLITIIFVGQNEFNRLLNKNEALRQRIAIFYNIKPLMLVQADKYIQHRLKVAGSDQRIFNQSAISEIFSFSKGNPRLINNICDLALLTGYVNEVKIIGPEIIRECAINFKLSSQSGKDKYEKEKPLVNTIFEDMTNKVRLMIDRRKISYFASAALILIGCLIGYYYMVASKTSSMNINNSEEKALGGFIESKLETSIQNSNEIAGHQGDIAKSQVRLLEFNDSKATEVTQIGQLKSEHEQNQANLIELNNAGERIAELEGAAKKREQLLAQTEQKLSELTKELEREKKSKQLIQAKLLSMDASVSELQEKLEASKSDALKFEGEIEKKSKEIRELQSQMTNAEIPNFSAEPSTVVVRTKDMHPAENDTIETETQPANPADIIDWILKKKSEE